MEDNEVVKYGHRPTSPVSTQSVAGETQRRNPSRSRAPPIRFQPPLRQSPVHIDIQISSESESEADENQGVTRVVAGDVASDDSLAYDNPPYVLIPRLKVLMEKV